VLLIFYNLGIYCLRLLFQIASLFNAKAKAFVSGRKSIFLNLRKTFADNQNPIIWVHCASLGEFEQGRPVIEALKREFVKHKILLTFFSPSGYEVRKNFPGADYVFYLPWDTTGNARKFVEIVNPALAIFIKYEFWYNFSTQLKSKNIPQLSVSSIFREDQVFFKPYGGLFRRTLKNFDYFFVQNETSVRLLRLIGIRNCMLAGDTRFDRVNEVVRKGEEISIAKAFKNNDKVLVAGSCWGEDLEVLIPFINENRMKFIIAPHEISEEFIADFEKSLQVKSVRFSNAAQATVADAQVLIIDNVGMLSRLYQYGEFAYIGGGFGKGLHNILEAACYGIPILFGDKNYEKFQEANDLINRGGAFPVTSYTDLIAQFEMLNVPENFLLACEVTKAYVSENLGATEKVAAYCRKLLK
jgi:3-deoxy-D-manno-octulosonic-acid transferase